jgi:membrane protein YdbS with pleckstrin-like domain
LTVPDPRGEPLYVGPTLPPERPGIVARWFRAPEGPPEPPAGRDRVAFRPASGFLSYLRTEVWTRTVLLGVMALGGGTLVVVGRSPVGAALLVGGGTFLFLLWVILDHWAMQLRFDHTWYVMTDRSLRIRRGIWTIQEGTVTFENVQNVRVRQGPLQRWFGIADVVLETAAAGVPTSQGTATASQAVIEGVADAPAIRDRIAERMRRSRSAGLGDDEAPGRGTHVSGRAATGRRAAGWSPAHLDTLREIRDTVRAMVPGGPGQDNHTD